jgi:acyl transferase domain-containing protein
MSGQQAIAVIGMSGRVPGASSVDALWTLLREGREGIRTLSRDEIEIDPELVAQPNWVAAQGVLDGIELFDADFFGYTAAEAGEADPQQRLLLECAWEALEHAGYDPAGLKTIPVGLYAGAGMSLYGLRRLFKHALPSVKLLQALVGCDKEYLATRISYKLGLTGPSHTVGSACSTSLLAAARACEQLLDFSIDLALAGGANVTFPHKTGYFHEEGGILSTDGHCRSFDARADGTVPSNGVALVVLKRLEDAIADGDFIWAVIRGFAVNNDGDDKVGYTAPSVGGQTRVIAKALAAAGLSPDDISYVETHGTGTAIGDPIEIQALTQAFAGRTKPPSSCPIGSIKSNLGHLNAVSGVAGFIKTVLALHHRELPPSLHFERPNPRIDFAKTPVFVNTVLRPWTGTPRFAGVSSFGFGGTNVHMILENAPVREPARPAAAPPHLLVLSARTETALAESANRLAAHLAAEPNVDLAAVASTLQSGRHLFRHRRGVVCETVDEAVDALGRTNRASVVRPGTRPPAVVFMFPGQGSQRPAMGRELYERESAFREIVDASRARLLPLIDHDVRELLISPEVDDERLEMTALAQPALFVFEIATAHLLRTMGLEPAAAIGHSVGEIAAAYIAGVFDLDGALELVAARSRLMQPMAAGLMLAVFAAESDIAALLPDNVEIAGVHRPDLCVVGGAPEAVADLQVALADRGIRATRLRTSHAFHTKMMGPMLAPLTAVAARIAARPPRIPVLSCTMGGWHALDAPIPPDAWATQVRRPVQLDRGLVRLFADFPNCVGIETGPGHTLADLASSHPARPKSAHVVSASGPDGSAGSVALRSAVVRAFEAGARVNFAAVRGTIAIRRVPLPTYPFERRAYWIEEPMVPTQQPVWTGSDVNSFVEILDV